MEPAQAPKSVRIELVGPPSPESPPVAHPLTVVSPRGLVIPSPDKVSALVEAVQTIDEMRDLHAAIAVMEELGKREKAAFEVTFQLAVERLHLERKMGADLLQKVRRGGHGSKSSNWTSIRGGCSSGLPKWICKQTAGWYRRLAAVPPDCMDRYLARQRELSKTPAANGLLELWRKETPGQKPRKRRRQTLTTPATPSAPGGELPATVIETIRRVSGIDVYVGSGDSPFPKARCVRPDVLRAADLRGTVFIAECLDPADWIPRLAYLYLHGKVEQVFGVVPAEPWAPWFKSAAESHWLCLFPLDCKAAILYRGSRCAGLCVALRAFGSALMTFAATR